MYVLSSYKSLVRPGDLAIEYGNLVWGPNYKTNIHKLEKLATKESNKDSIIFVAFLCSNLSYVRFIIRSSIRYLDYREKLKVLKLPLLFYRQHRGDMADCST